MDDSVPIVIVFIFIHLFSIYISLPKLLLRRFISFSAGVGIAYVFIHMWPQVAYYQRLAEENIPWLIGSSLQHLLYLIALSGIVIIYAMDRLIARAYADEEITNPNVLTSALFKVNIVFFALYNAMIGYLLAYESEVERSIVIYFIAFSLHFITNDWTLRREHQSAYDRYGRWILSFSILGGYLLGSFANLPTFFIGGIEAFVAGAMTLNVIKHELPSERDGNLKGFLTGVISAGFLFMFL